MFFCAAVPPCASVTCENGGTCVEGTCECYEGFTGDRCQNQSKSLLVFSLALNFNPCQGN